MELERSPNDPDKYLRKNPEHENNYSTIDRGQVCDSTCQDYFYSNYTRGIPMFTKVKI